MKSKTSPILSSLLSLTIIFCFSFFGSSQVYSQDFRELINNPNENTTLQEVVALADAYYETNDKGRGSGYKQYERWLHKMKLYVSPDNLIKKNFNAMSMQVAEATMPQLGNRNRMVGAWQPLGPTSVVRTGGYLEGLGRVNVIAFHPTDQNTFYLGTPAGGLWKTTDNAATWNSMSDFITRTGVSGIAIDHNTPETMYILTGDGDGAPNQGTWSIGILKSTDGGSTWAATGYTLAVQDFIKGYKLLMHPTDPDIMFATTIAGLLKTTDGWSTFTTVQTGNFRDVEFKPGDPSIVYATTRNRFYKSTDAGDTFTETTSGLTTGENRLELAVSPASANSVYVLASSASGALPAGQFRGLFLSSDSGDSFSQQTNTPNILGGNLNGGGTGSQGSYDLAIAVSPEDASIVNTGGINTYRSTDSGVTMIRITHWDWRQPIAFEYTHADVHELVYNPLNNNLYTGTDGGISVSTDDGLNWSTIWDGLSIMQFYDITGIESDPNIIIGGTQDNGTNKYVGNPLIEHINGADGGGCMIDYNNPDIIYSSWQRGVLWKSTDGGATRTNISPAGASGPFITKYEMDPNTPEIIYGGYINGIRRSADAGANWSNIGSSVGNALAVGDDNPARLYAAAGSNLQTTADTGSNWSTITGPWPNLTITSITIDPDDANKVWITLGGYTAGEKVYHSDDAGASWTNVSGTLPNVPALSSDIDNRPGASDDSIYVGMDVGVYFSSDFIPWMLYETGIPNVPIYDLQINESNELIRAGTFGRGLWEAPLFNPVLTVICKDITKQLDANGFATILPSDIDNGSFDPDRPVVLSVFPNNFTCADVGPNIVTLTATDINGNTATCDATVTVEDNIAPVIACIADDTISTDAGFCTYTVKGTEYDATFTDNCSGIITNDLNNTNTIAGVELYFGTTTTVIWTVDDGNGQSDTCTTIITVDNIITTSSVTVAPNPQQYSDLVTFEATLTAGNCAGAGQAATEVSFYVGTQFMGTVPLSIVGNDLVGTLTDAPLLETPSQPSNGQMAPGVHTVEAVFGGVVNPNYTITDPTTPLTITPEDAIVEYTGHLFQATAPNSNVATVILSANIQDITITDPDPDAGDIRNASVKFVDRAGGDISGWLPVVDLFDPSDPTTGTVSFDWVVNLGNQTSASVTVGIVVNNYYTRNDGTDDVVVTVYKPVGDFITGGGFIMPENSAGQYASTPGLKANFGFNVKYNKKGKRLRGHMNIIFRRLEADGVHAYQIKGNAIQSLGVNVADEDNKFGEFITKANLKDVTDPDNPFSLGGNLTLKVELIDRGEPGENDEIGVNLTNSSGILLYSSNWSGISTEVMYLSGGNLVIHSGFSLDPLLGEVKGLSTVGLIMYPNPASNRVMLRNPQKTDLNTVSIYDLSGRIVKFKDLSNMETEIGIDISNLKAAVYMVIIKNDYEQITKQLIIK